MRFATHPHATWIALLVCCQFGERSLQADFIWDGGLNGTGTAFFNEANWFNEATGFDPPAGTIDPNNKISFNLIVNFGSIGGNFDTGNGVQNHIVLDFNRKLTVNGGTLNLRDDRSLIGAGGEDFGSSFLELNGGEVDTFFLHALKVDLSGGASLIIRSSETTLYEDSTLNFNSHASSILFANKTAADLSSEIAATTVFGQPAVVGQNLLVTDNAFGALMQVSTPEPSTFLLTACGAGILGICRRRWRRKR